MPDSPSPFQPGDLIDHDFVVEQLLAVTPTPHRELPRGVPGAEEELERLLRGVSRG